MTLACIKMAGMTFTRFQSFCLLLLCAWPTGLLVQHFVGH